MNNGIFALYNGAEYETALINDQEVVLRSDNPEDIKQGFVLYKGVKYIKRVSRSELTDVYKKKYVVKYKSYVFYVIKITPDKVLIRTINMDFEIAEQLNMQLVERGVYQKWISKNEAEISLHIEPI